jgi:hypothetical protein
LVFAFATDDKSLTVFGTESEAISYCELIDVENDGWLFWDDSGLPLRPEPASIVVLGSKVPHFRLAPDRSGCLQPLRKMLSSVSYLERNPRFASIEAIAAFVSHLGSDGVV